MAEALFKARVDPEIDAADWRIESAGTWATGGAPAAAKSRQVLQEAFNLDITSHRSRCVSRELLRSFDLILVMERGHKEALIAEFPEISGRVFLLSEMAGSVRDVRDPYTGSLADYEDTARELDLLITQGYGKIIQLAQKSTNSKKSQGGTS